MVPRPDSISSEKPLSCASAAERLRNSGRTERLRLIVIHTDTGTVTMNTASSIGEIISMPINAPTTVMIPVAACRISLDKEALTVSMSYEMRLMISPACNRSKYPTGSVISFSKTSCRMRRMIFWLKRIIMTDRIYDSTDEAA